MAIKVYSTEEYYKQVVKDTKKLSEYFMTLSKSIEINDKSKMRDTFKKIARLMCTSRNWNGFPQTLRKYMDIDFYARR